jgi:hypothetical protein
MRRMFGGRNLSCSVGLVMVFLSLASRKRSKERIPIKMDVMLCAVIHACDFSTAEFQVILGHI